MPGKKCNMNDNINNIKNLLGKQTELVIGNLIIGSKNSLEAAIIYVNGLTDKNIIDRDILKPLMLNANEDFSNMQNIEDYIHKKYIAVSDTYVETDINKAVEGIKRGKTVLLIQDSCNFITINTAGGTYRFIAEPENDPSLRVPREDFVENLDTNISILRRRIKDKINTIDMDSVPATSFIEQCIEEHPYSIFPQTIGSERPDVIESHLMQGKIAFLLSGTSYVTTYPSIFIEFFQTIEDYYGRTLQAWFTRSLRFIAVFMVITFPAIYITFVKFNPELIPVEYIKSLISATQGIVLTPFMSLLIMQLTIEFLREGGLRIPGKIGHTVSVVGGIIIGDAALKAKIVSPTTLLIAGVTTVASFVISNYQMAIAIRTLTYPMLILANWLGVLGIVIGCFSILAYLCSLENFGVPYFAFHKSDMKDTFIRAPLWRMNKRPEAIPHNDPIRQSNFRGGKK